MCKGSFDGVSFDSSFMSWSVGVLVSLSGGVGSAFE